MEKLTTRHEDYDEKHCWQYDIRVKNLEEDIKNCLFRLETIKALKPKDFELRNIAATDKEAIDECISFIKRHEWLGKMPQRPTNYFGAFYKGVLAGVVVMATPNAFSNLCGKENSDKEKLISRGACISWSPKGLASRLISYSINWMVKNTKFRVFTAYSDPEAKELGTIYQACNFIYLGQSFGSRYMFLDPKRPEKEWFSSRVFRKVGSYKRYAKDLNIAWEKSWSSGCKMNWNNVPDGVESSLRFEAKEYEKRCIRRTCLPKHKYCYVKGRTRLETKELLKALVKQNKKYEPKGPDTRPGLPYPKQRGE